MKRNARTLTRIRDLVAATVLFGLFISGCSTSTENEDLETTASATKTEIVPTTATEYVPASADGPAQNVPVPEMPELAKEPTQEGAEAALEYFWETYQYLRETGDPQLLNSVSTENCDYCSDSAIKWEGHYKNDNAWLRLHGDFVIVDLGPPWIITDKDSDDPSEIHIQFELTGPATDLFIDGDFIEDQSYSESHSDYWIVILEFNKEQSFWQVNWLGPDAESNDEE